MIIVEGCKKSGKSYLIDEASQCLDIMPWKFPYVDYFEEFLKKTPIDTGQNSREVHHFAHGFDITLLSMNKMYPHRFRNFVVDRGFISNIVLSLMQDRSTDEEEEQYLDYLEKNGLLDHIHIVYIEREAPMIERNKDSWEFLDQDRQADLFKKYLALIQKRELVDIQGVHYFKNTFDDDAKNRFIQLIKTIR